MKFLYGIVLVASMCGMASAQNAKVIQLSPDDAKAAKAIEDEQNALNAKRDALRYLIQQKYLTTSERTHATAWSFSTGGKAFYFKNGWGFGDFEFSDDFKFIVPKQSATITGGGITYGGMNCCSSFTTTTN